MQVARNNYRFQTDTTTNEYRGRRAHSLIPSSHLCANWEIRLQLDAQLISKFQSFNNGGVMISYVLLLTNDNITLLIMKKMKKMKKMMKIYGE